ncbi:hypothetical protein JCM17960_21520 [Magnetospira thiophila]
MSDEAVAEAVQASRRPLLFDAPFNRRAFPLPRKPNYKFERQERDRIKAAKKAARAQDKTERPADPDPTPGEPNPPTTDTPES